MKRLHFFLTLFISSFAVSHLSYSMGKKPEVVTEDSQVSESNSSSNEAPKDESMEEASKEATENIEAVVQDKVDSSSDQSDVIEGDMEYGEYLAGECFACHSHEAHGIPVIDGIEKEYFLEAMIDYQDGWRENEVMQSVAQSLGEEELAALAAYFSSLTPKSEN